MFHSIKKLWVLLKPYHTQLYVLTMLWLIYETFKMLESYFQATILRLFENQVAPIGWFAFFLGLLFFDEIFMRLDNFVDIKISNTNNLIYKYLRVEALTKLFGLDIAWHRDSNSGDLTQKINKGIDEVNNLIREASWNIVPTILQVIVTLIPIFIFSPWVACVLTTMLIIFLYESRNAYIAQKPLRTRRHDLYERDSKKTSEWIRGIETLRYSGAQDRFANEYLDLHEEIIDVAAREVWSMTKIHNRRRLRILSYTRRGIWALFAWQLYYHTLSVVDFVFMITLAEKALNSFWRLAHSFDIVGEALEGIDRLIKLLALHNALDYGTVTLDQIDHNGVIVFDNVSFRYPDSQLGVKNINLRAEQGRVVALVGETGSGKSTMMNLLMRFYDPSEGLITIGGVNIRDLSAQALHNCFALVPQEVDIFDGSVWYNITLGADVNLESVEDVCHKAAFHDTVCSFASTEERDSQFAVGLERLIGEKGVKISGGQKQRLAIARALLQHNALVLVLDEPTSAQDANTESDIQKGVFTNNGIVTFVIAHRLSTIRDADIILAMRNGEIVEQGTHIELLSKNGYYAELVAKQLS